MFHTAVRNKENDDSKKEPMDAPSKSALGRRASGVTPKMSKPGDQVFNACQIYLNPFIPKGA